MSIVNTCGQPRCAHASCDQPVYGQNVRCYFHRKMENGLIDKADRDIYLRNEGEKLFVKVLDAIDIPAQKRLDTLREPFSEDVIKLSSYILRQKYKLTIHSSITDVSSLIIIKSATGFFPPADIYSVDEAGYKSYLNKYAHEFIRECANAHRQETKHKRYEVPLEIFRDNELVMPITPESIMIQEEEENLKARAVYSARKCMTTIEKKIFSKLQRGMTERTVANQLHLSVQRVNKLKQRACLKVQKIYEEIQ